MMRDPAHTPAPERAPDPAAELLDQLWNDPRRRDDRTEFFECDHCGRAVRWVENLASDYRSSLQIVARALVTPIGFDPHQHRGLIAVYTDRSGFTVSRFTTREDVADTLLYECHWDVCAPARATRDRLHRARASAVAAERAAEPDWEMQDRYAAWRRGQGEQQ